MAYRDIKLEGDPVLYKKCREVTDFNDRIRTLLDDMKETLTRAQGVGLAAPQVGILRRAVVIEVDDPDADDSLEENPKK